MLSPYRIQVGTSATFTGTAPGQYLFKRDMGGSLPTESVMTPDGLRRPVMTALLVECAASITVAAATTVNEEDFAGLIRRLTFRDLDGDRYLMSGFKARMFGHQEYGTSYPTEPALVTNAGPVSRTYSHLIPFAIPSAERPWDYALPVDDALNNSCEWRIDSPADADILRTGAGAVTLASLTYTVYAYLRLESDVEIKSRFCAWESDGETNTSDFRLNFQGRAVRSITLCKEAADGGASVTTVLAITIPTWRQTNISRNASKVDYCSGAAFRGLVVDETATGDPVFNDKAVSILAPVQKIVDMPLIVDTLNIKLSTTLAAPYSFFMTGIAAHSPTLVDAIARRYGKSAAPMVKTDSKGSERGFGSWKSRASFMPLKLA